MLTSLLSLYITSVIHLPMTMPTQESLPKLTFFQSKEIAITPIKKREFISPIIDATSSIAIDIGSGEILFEKNSHQRLSIASITKLMTILIILEENDLTEIVSVSTNAANTEGSSMNLRAQEQIAIENLLYGAIIHSANDAAVALAEHNAGSVSAFVEKMNEKTKILGLLNTHFTNPIGLDNSNNFSSSYDIAKLGEYIYQNDFVGHAAQFRELEVKSVSGKYIHKLESTNDLLGNNFLNIKGLKTGRTDAAGQCLVSVAENDGENEILTVVLNSPARFTETKILVDWVFRAYNW